MIFKVSSNPNHSMILVDLKDAHGSWSIAANMKKFIKFSV